MTSALKQLEHTFRPLKILIEVLAIACSQDSHRMASPKVACKKLATAP